MKIFEYHNKEIDHSIFLPQALIDYDFDNNAYIDYVIDFMPLFGFMFEREIDLNNPPADIKFKSDNVIEEIIRLNASENEIVSKKLEAEQADISTLTKVIAYLQKIKFNDKIDAYKTDNDCYLPLTLTEIDMINKGYKPYKELGIFTFENVTIFPYENITIRECLLMNYDSKVHGEYVVSLYQQAKNLYKDIAEIMDMAKKDKVFVIEPDEPFSETE